jgi:hypothetical protein
MLADFEKKKAEAEDGDDVSYHAFFMRALVIDDLGREDETIPRRRCGPLSPSQRSRFLSLSSEKGRARAGTGSRTRRGVGSDDGGYRNKTWSFCSHQGQIKRSGSREAWNGCK